MNKIIKYLQGSESNNYLGTILGIQKGKHSKLNSIPTAVLLYFDQRTGRIERYLVNSADQQPVKILLDHEKYHMPQEQFSFKNLDDGKLDTRFFNSFLLELFRDYMHTSHSFKICDMNNIRNYTLPLYEYGDESNPNIKKISIGSRTRIPNTVLLKGTQAFINKRFVELNSSVPYILNTPQFLNSYSNKGSLESVWNIKLNPYVIDAKSPQALYDFKICFNNRTVLDLSHLNDQIIEFNKRILEKLNRLEENS